MIFFIVVQVVIFRFPKRETVTERQTRRQAHRERETQTDRQTEADRQRWDGGGSRLQIQDTKYCICKLFAHTKSANIMHDLLSLKKSICCRILSDASGMLPEGNTVANDQQSSSASDICLPRPWPSHTLPLPLLQLFSTPHAVRHWN